MNHTPGPWTFEDRDDEGLDGNIWSPNNQDIAMVYCTDMERGMADARLISAAPDLLHALEELLIWTVLKEKGSPYLTNMRKPIVINQVKEAILKATGAPLRIQG